jgi:membrane protease YdiL (CAAX protease family)
MGSELRSTLFKLLVPALVIGIVLVASRRRGLAWGDDLGLVWTGVRPLLLWIAIWAAWVALGEWAIDTFGLDQAKPWKHVSAVVLVLRILAIGIVGPVSEEMVMRGIVFAQLRRTALHTAGAIVVCAAVWAVMHVQYGWSTWVLIFLDGLILGMARAHSRSLVPPIVMHMLGNLFSIGQSLHR